MIKTTAMIKYMYTIPIKDGVCIYISKKNHEATTWWHHQMESFSALLALCEGNSLVTGEFPTQRPVTRGFDVFFDLRLNKRLSKQSWGWWFRTSSRPLWRHCNHWVSYWFVALNRWWLSRDHLVKALNQCKPTLHCNVVFNWLGAFTKRSLTSCQSHHRNTFQYTFHSKFRHFLSGSLIWNCRLQNGCHLVPTSMC